MPRATMPRASHPPPDPAADAAGLLRRLGFATLMLAVPVAALVTRRALVVLVPIAAVLLVLAAALDGMNRPLASARGTLRAPATLAALLLLGWCALSLAWTPFPREAAERLVGIAGAVGVAVAGALALPERMRSANLYILPVGVAIAAALAAFIGLFGWPARWSPDEGAQNLQRGLAVLVLLFWPALAWLRSRRRDLEALLLAAAAGTAILLGGQAMPALALGVGALAYGLTLLEPRRGVRLTAGTMAALLALAPLIPLLMRPLLSGVTGSGASALLSLRVWRDVIVAEPVRVITGHGFETALRSRLINLLPMDAPTTLLFEVWYELGLVGALSGAAALWAAATGAGRQHAVLVPGMMAGFASAFTFACLGIGTAQIWWFTALSGAVLVFVACERGQFRTRRPRVAALDEMREAA